MKICSRIKQKKAEKTEKNKEDKIYFCIPN